MQHNTDVTTEQSFRYIELTNVKSRFPKCIITSGALKWSHSYSINKLDQKLKLKIPTLQYYVHTIMQANKHSRYRMSANHKSLMT